MDRKSPCQFPHLRQPSTLGGGRRRRAGKSHHVRFGMSKLPCLLAHRIERERLWRERRNLAAHMPLVVSLIEFERCQGYGPPPFAQPPDTRIEEIARLIRVPQQRR